MKINFIITDLSSGGAERVVSLLANYFSKKGHCVKIILVQDDVVDYAIEKNIEIVYLERKHRFPLSVIERVLAIRKATNHAEIVISFLWHINIYTILATRFRKQKVIISDRSDPVNELNDVTALHRLLRNLCYGMADKIVFQTNDARAHYKDTIQKKGIIIPNPLTPSLPYWKGSEQGKKVVITTGRLSEQKNYPMAIQAFSCFYKTHPDYSYIIYGEGPLRSELEKLIEEQGMKEKITLAGFSNHVFEALSESSIFILASNYEGISNSMLEALAIGIPSVVTDCPAGGARMFIRDRENGILVPTNDADALLKGMTEIADNPIYAKKMSENSQKIREQLEPDVICQHWARTVEE